MGPVRIHHSSHDFGWQSSQSVDLAGWQAKMASIEIWIPWRNAHKPHLCLNFVQTQIGPFVDGDGSPQCLPLRIEHCLFGGLSSSCQTVSCRTNFRTCTKFRHQNRMENRKTSRKKSRQNTQDFAQLEVNPRCQQELLENAWADAN